MLVSDEALTAMELNHTDCWETLFHPSPVSDLVLLPLYDHTYPPRNLLLDLLRQVLQSVGKK